MQDWINILTSLIQEQQALHANVLQSTTNIVKRKTTKEEKKVLMA